MRPQALHTAREAFGWLAVAVLALLCAAFLSGCDRLEGLPIFKRSSKPAAATPALPEASTVKDAPAPAATAGRGVPRAAAKYRADLTRNARAVWGLDAPVAVFAGQIHQESGWRETVKSPVGAQGMAQFMPATAKWISGAYPELRANEPMNPSWALRALVTYDRHLWERVQAASSCDRMAFALSAYNGGLGWVQRDRKVAADQGLEPGRWWANVEQVNAGRSAANWRENRGYPERILRKLAQVYASAGWGQGVCQ